MSHAKRGIATHIGVMSISMTRLILAMERHGRTAWIDVVADTYARNGACPASQSLLRHGSAEQLRYIMCKWFLYVYMN
jgi:hypothetical protein